jgi:hypothetical protein
MRRMVIVEGVGLWHSAVIRDTLLSDQLIHRFILFNDDVLLTSEVAGYFEERLIFS